MSFGIVADCRRREAPPSLARSAVAAGKYKDPGKRIQGDNKKKIELGY